MNIYRLKDIATSIMRSLSDEDIDQIQKCPSLEEILEVLSEAIIEYEEE